MMVRGYTVFCDLWNGGETEDNFRFREDAEKKFDSISNVPYKVLIACDDKTGDAVVRSWKADGWCDD